MTRSLTSATKTELATNDIRPVHLITIGFGTPVNITDCSFPITSSVSGSSVTYIASDFIMGVSDFTEETVQDALLKAFSWPDKALQRDE